MLKQKKLSFSRLGKSMILSTLCKPIGMLLSFLYTPLLLNCLGEESYGIWSTILSIINWINYFDVGIGNGLRNQLTKDVERKDNESARSSVSTAYILLSLVSFVILLFGSIIIYWLNCQKLFKTEINVKPVLYISFLFICINFVLSLCKMQLYATQQAEKVGLMTVLTQFLNLLGVFILNLSGKGSLMSVAFIIGMSGIVVNLVFTKKIWSFYPEFTPHFYAFSRGKVSMIGNLGIKFFVVQIAALVLYTTDNLIITYLLGPKYVTPYNTVYTAFGLINGMFSAMMLPLWSKYTEAMERRDFRWIRDMIIKLDMLLIPIAIILVFGVFVYKPLSIIWLHKNLLYDKGLILAMAVYYFLYIWGTIYSTALNGMGKVSLQAGLGVTTAILNVPLSIFLGKNVGLNSTGVLVATIICMIITNIPITIRVHRYLNIHILKSA